MNDMFAQNMLDQSHSTSEDYMVEAIKRIDRNLGKGYARNNPDLIGTFMKVSSNDFKLALNYSIESRKLDLL